MCHFYKLWGWGYRGLGEGGLCNDHLRHEAGMELVYGQDLEVRQCVTVVTAMGGIVGRGGGDLCNDQLRHPVHMELVFGEDLGVRQCVTSTSYGGGGSSIGVLGLLHLIILSLSNMLNILRFARGHHSVCRR